MLKQTAEMIQTPKLSMNSDFKAFNESSTPQEGSSENLEKDLFAGYRKGDQWSREYELDDEEDINQILHPKDDGVMGNMYGSEEAENKVRPSEEDDIGGYYAEEANPDPYKIDSERQILDTPPTTTTGTNWTSTHIDMQQESRFGAYMELANNNTNDTSGASYREQFEQNRESEEGEEDDDDDDDYEDQIMMEADIECCRILEQKEQQCASMDGAKWPDIELGTPCGEEYTLYQDIEQLGYQHTYTPYPPYVFIAPIKSEVSDEEKNKKKKRKKNPFSLPNKEDYVEPPEVHDLMSICSDESWEVARSIYTNEDHVQELCSRVGNNPDPDDIPAERVFNRPVPEFVVPKAEIAPHQSGKEEHKKAKKRFSWLRFLHRHPVPETAPVIVPPKAIHFSHEKRTLSFDGEEEWKEFQNNAETSNSNPEPFEPIPVLSIPQADTQAKAEQQKEEEKVNNASAEGEPSKLRSCFKRLHMILKVGEKRKDTKKKHFKKLRQLIHDFSWSKKSDKVVLGEAPDKQEKIPRSCLKVRSNPNLEEETARAQNCDLVDSYHQFRLENLYRNECDRHDSSARKYRRAQLLQFYDQVCQESESSVPNG